MVGLEEVDCFGGYFGVFFVGVVCVGGNVGGGLGGFDEIVGEYVIFYFFVGYIGEYYVVDFDVWGKGLVGFLDYFGVVVVVVDDIDVFKCEVVFVYDGVYVIGLVIVGFEVGFDVYVGSVVKDKNCVI